MKILVAGIGNIFFGDDAFGCEIISELNRRGLPEGVTAIDFGIRSYDLAYALTNHFNAVILVDACPLGGRPGSLYLVEPDNRVSNEAEKAAIDGHALNPVAVLQMAQSLGRLCERLYLIGCEPEICECEDGRMGLSPIVRDAVPGALAMIDSLVTDLLGMDEQKQEIAGLAPA